MTVTYTHHVASCKGFGCFWKLLFRWKGGIYKLVYPDLILYTLLYATCSVTYRVFLDEEQKRVFEKVSVHCQQFTDLIPVAFVLGFYVSIVVQRWWAQYMSLPWPDALALFVSTCIVGQDERSRVMRRTIMRYVNLTFVITLSMISPRVKKRFPTLDHVMEAGFMTAQEKKIFEDLNRKTSHPKYWMPLVWAGTIVARARKEGRIRDDFAVKSLIDEISKFRGLSGGLLSYDWISIPLVYTQVVTLAVYTFFIGTIMGRQFLDPAQNIPNYPVDFYVPCFTFLQFFFYMGWLKVAETLINPFGEDDDDFEVNWLIDRNFQVSYLIVDEMHEEHPELIQDVYWDEVFPQSLPYTVASEGYRRMAPQGSTFNMQVPEAEQEILLVPLNEEDEDEGSDSGHVKIDIGNMRGSRESLQSFSSGLAMKVRPQGSAPERKGSMLSVLLSRVMNPNASDGGTARFSRLGSTLSMKSRRTVGGRVNRNSSHLSTVSRGSSRASLSKPTPRRVPSSASVARHALSSDELAEGEPPRWLDREVSMDEDGAILIRVKPDSERKPHSVKSVGELTPAMLQMAVPASTTSLTSPTSPAKRPGLTLPSSSSSASIASKVSFARLPSLSIGKRPLASKPNLAALQMGSVSSSADAGSHLLSQELGSDDEVQTPWGVSDPPSPEYGSAHSPKLGDTGTIRRKGKGTNPSDETPTSARSQPCKSNGSATDVLAEVRKSGPLYRGVSEPYDWSSTNEGRMFNFLTGHEPRKAEKAPFSHDNSGEQNSNKDGSYSSVLHPSDGCFLGGEDSPNKSESDALLGSFRSQGAEDRSTFAGLAGRAATAPASPTSVVPDIQYSVSALLGPESSTMSLSDRFSSLIKESSDTSGVTEPDALLVPYTRRAASIPEGLDVVNEENEAIEEESDDSQSANKTSSVPCTSSDPGTGSGDAQSKSTSDPPEPPLHISESSVEGRP